MYSGFTNGHNTSLFTSLKPIHWPANICRSIVREIKAEEYSKTLNVNNPTFREIIKLIIIYFWECSLVLYRVLTDWTSNSALSLPFTLDLWFLYNCRHQTLILSILPYKLRFQHIVSMSVFIVVTQINPLQASYLCVHFIHIQIDIIFWLIWNHSIQNNVLYQ